LLGIWRLKGTLSKLKLPFWTYWKQIKRFWF
jgi:hypothetical protein